MQMAIWSVARAILLLTTSLNAAHGLTINNARDLIPSPSQDPFYVPPSGFESASPGAVLRSRNVSSGRRVRHCYRHHRLQARATLSHPPTMKVQTPLLHKGWTAGGIPANLTYIFEFIDGSLLSGVEIVALAGLMKPSAYGATLKPFIDGISTPALQKLLQFANTQCFVPDLLAFPFQSLFDTKYQSLGKDVLTNLTMLSALQDNTLGVDKAQKPTAPFLMFHAKPDELVAYAPAAKVHDTWCDNGATVEFVEYANGGHVTTAVLGLVDALKFADDSFNNQVASGCTSKTVLDDTLNPLAFGVALEPLAVGLINYLIALGRKDANWLAGIKEGKPIAL
ncbi:hypothetical protein G3M48_004209 [Beauveria asiatica]|uniref:Secretory lipase n=1 Tax=Beauveria asiatica TaxID=1069075 RepID=A0AAW0RUE9_9HYPO